MCETDRSIWNFILKIAKEREEFVKHLEHDLIYYDGKQTFYDVLQDEFVVMFDAGVVDPKIVTVSALQNAVSVAGTVLTTGVLVTEIPEEKSCCGGGGDAAAAAAAMGGMPGMM